MLVIQSPSDSPLLKGRNVRSSIENREIVKSQMDLTIGQLDDWTIVFILLKSSNREIVK